MIAIEESRKVVDLSVECCSYNCPPLFQLAPPLLPTLFCLLTTLAEAGSPFPFSIHQQKSFLIINTVSVVSLNCVEKSK